MLSTDVVRYHILDYLPIECLFVSRFTNKDWMESYQQRREEWHSCEYLDLYYDEIDPEDVFVLYHEFQDLNIDPFKKGRSFTYWFLSEVISEYGTDQQKIRFVQEIPFYRCSQRGGSTLYYAPIQMTTRDRFLFPYVFNDTMPINVRMVIVDGLWESYCDDLNSYHWLIDEMIRCKFINQDMLRRYQRRYYQPEDRREWLFLQRLTRALK